MIKKDNTKKTRRNNIKDGYFSILSLDSGYVFEFLKIHTNKIFNYRLALRDSLRSYNQFCELT